MIHHLNDTIPCTSTATGNTVEDGRNHQSQSRPRLRPAKPRHPYEVLRSLPPDATPAQQDSAIQAVFQPEVIERSTRPDTLHMPGHGKGKDFKEVNLPNTTASRFLPKTRCSIPN